MDHEAEHTKRVHALHLIVMSMNSAHQVRQKAKVFRYWQHAKSNEEHLCLQVELYRLTNQVNQLQKLQHQTTAQFES